MLMSVAAELRVSELVDAPNALVSAALPLDVFENGRAKGPATDGPVANRVGVRAVSRPGWTRELRLPAQFAAPITSVALPEAPFGSTQTTVVFVLIGESLVTLRTLRTLRSLSAILAGLARGAVVAVNRDGTVGHRWNR